ncbi:MAG: ABC transporter substrate-binding protein, partial [Clostridia bacterium]|nr:ABC transporter substrate-binding protein [Clostridia bacterium]
MWKKNFWGGKLAFLLLFLLLLGGCADPAGEGNGVEYTDALGRQVTLPKDPQRVACMIGSFADVWVLAGGEVAATAKDAWDDFGLDLPEAVNIGKIKEPNVELLLSADPDLVIASAGTASNVELLGTLEGAGIPVVYFEIETFSDYLEMLKVCTDLTGRDDLYRRNGLEVADEIEKI